MAMMNPVGRVNYEPNSWGAQGGPRENPAVGTRSFADADMGPKQRLRPESFADHYSQARQFFISQTPTEQNHLADALVFELSKVERPDIRARMLSHLVHIHDDLVNKVANGLGMAIPTPAKAARPTNKKLKPSDALSILKRGPETFEGRKVGILATDGADADLYKALIAAIDKEGATAELVAPKIAGVTLSDGTLVPAKQKIDGGPSVLYDAVALLVSAEGADLIVPHKAVQDFISDAFAHCKFIAYVEAAQPLLQAAGIADKLDSGTVPLKTKKDADRFIQQCRALRLWEREPGTKPKDERPKAPTRRK
jgi:catalase